MKNILFILVLLFSLHSFGQKEKIYGNWESQYSSESVQGDGGGFKVFVEETTQYLRGDRINIEGTMLFEYDWNDEEAQTLLGSRFKISYFGYGSWSVDEEFLITTLENINPMIDDEYGIEYINSDDGVIYGQYSSDYIEQIVSFNETYPKANIYAIILCLEDVLRSVSQNLFMPLILLNMILDIQKNLNE